jgi:hypothetical protein
MPKTFVTEGKVWKYEGPAGWYFVYVDKKVSEEIAGMPGKKRVGWGFVPIRATIGETAWTTTLFPTKEKDYLLAIKADVRRKEGVDEGDMVRVSFVLI